MQPLSEVELLGAWERGLNVPPLERALTLLAAACPDTPPDDLADLSVGRRDARLLTLREWSFGSRLTGLASCAACGERIEVAFDVADIRVAPEPDVEVDAGSPGPAGPDDLLALSVDGYDLRFRVPTSRDLAATASSGDGDAIAAHQQLLGRCLVTASHDGAAIASGGLPDDVVDALVARLAEADPQAEVQLALGCPACGHEWDVIFDIASFFWREIDAWAERLLGEVHVLARAYGWREAEILALSSRRRRRYLELVQA